MAARPRIITARSIGLAFQNLFGDLGPEVDVTGHYSAGGRARTWQEAVARAQSFHADHKAKGWGGIGYHFVIADDGALNLRAADAPQGGAHGGPQHAEPRHQLPGDDRRPTDVEAAGDLPLAAGQRA